MQAITTKYLPATNYKPSRIKAVCERGSVIVSYDCGLNAEAAHRLAVVDLVQKFCREDFTRYGSPVDKNPWNRPFVTGQSAAGPYVHVFTA